MIGAWTTLITGIVLALIGLGASLFEITPVAYFAIALFAGVCFGITLLAISANMYARKTGKFMPLASYYRSFDYLTKDEQAHYKLKRASLAAQLIFLLFEIVVYAVCIGVAILVVVVWPFGPVLSH